LGNTSGEKHFLRNTFTGNKLIWKSSSWETLQGKHILSNTFAGNKLSGKSSSWETLQGSIFLETLVREIK
jgi:hypothetical protein